jgi:hypothetical protein
VFLILIFFTWEFLYYYEFLYNKNNKNSPVSELMIIVFIAKWTIVSYIMDFHQYQDVNKVHFNEMMISALH